MSLDGAVLIDMLNACRSGLEFAGDTDRDTFLADRKTQSAVLHQLLLLGEAVKRLSAEVRQAHPEVPWREIAGLRDRLIHAYDRVDLLMVWETLKQKLPELMVSLQSMIPDDSDEV